jgi:hypothetical protein
MREGKHSAWAAAHFRVSHTAIWQLLRMEAQGETQLAHTAVTASFNVAQRLKEGTAQDSRDWVALAYGIPDHLGTRSTPPRKRCTGRALQPSRPSNVHSHG